MVGQLDQAGICNNLPRRRYSVIVFSHFGNTLRHLETSRRLDSESAVESFPINDPSSLVRLGFEFVVGLVLREPSRPMSDVRYS